MNRKYKFWYDILRDKNSTKYSITKFVGLSGFALFAASIIIGLIIMVMTQQIDHILIGELIAFILTLLGYKNVANKKTERPTRDELNNPDNDIINDEIG
ncbi:MAG: hypothetical protein ACOC33_00995 [bacterium]